MENKRTGGPNNHRIGMPCNGIVKRKRDGNICSIQVSNEWLKVWPIIHRGPNVASLILLRQKAPPHQIDFIAVLSASGCWRQLAPSALLIQHTHTHTPIQRRAKSSFPSWHQSHTSTVHTSFCIIHRSSGCLNKIRRCSRTLVQTFKNKVEPTAANQRHLAVNPASHGRNNLAEGESEPIHFRKHFPFRVVTSSTGP